MSANINIGIIGVNGRGRIWRFLHKPENGVVVSAGMDISEKNLERFKKQCNLKAFTTMDHNSLVQRDDLDAVVVASPDHCHAEHAIAALNAGKHVYCEKPLAITIDQCDRILDAAKASSGKLMVGFNMRYMPFVRKMKEIVESGAIGEIKAVWVRHFVGMGSVYYYHDWGALRRNSSSLLLQKGSHDLDVVHFVTGKYIKKAVAFGGLDFFGGEADNELECADCDKYESCVDSIIDHTDLERKPERRFCAFRKEVDIPDNYVCLFEMDGGVKFSYNECHFTPDYHRNYTFIGTKGRLENCEIDDTIRIWKRKRGKNDVPDEVIDVSPKGENGYEDEVGHGGADPLICDEFVSMIRDDREPSVPPLAGRMAVAAGLCAQKSLDAGGVLVNIPPYIEKQ